MQTMYRASFHTYEIAEKQIVKETALTVTLAGEPKRMEHKNGQHHAYFSTRATAEIYLRERLIRTIQHHETELKKYWELLNRLT
jgi:hypothetical protein